MFMLLFSYDDELAEETWWIWKKNKKIKMDKSPLSTQPIPRVQEKVQKQPKLRKV